MRRLRVGRRECGQELVEAWRSRSECEQAFFNRPFLAVEDEKHSTVETRYFALGATDAGRRLFIVFTIREQRVRVISVRDRSRHERRIYEEKTHSEI